MSVRVALLGGCAALTVPDRLSADPMMRSAWAPEVFARQFGLEAEAVTEARLARIVARAS